MMLDVVLIFVIVYSSLLVDMMAAYLSDQICEHRGFPLVESLLAMKLEQQVVVRAVDVYSLIVVVDKDGNNQNSTYTIELRREQSQTN